MRDPLLHTKFFCIIQFYFFLYVVLFYMLLLINRIFPFPFLSPLLHVDLYTQDLLTCGLLMVTGRCLIWWASSSFPFSSRTLFVFCFLDITLFVWLFSLLNLKYSISFLLIRKCSLFSFSFLLLLTTSVLGSSREIVYNLIKVLKLFAFPLFNLLLNFWSPCLQFSLHTLFHLWVV